MSADPEELGDEVERWLAVRTLAAATLGGWPTFVLEQLGAITDDIEMLELAMDERARRAGVVR